VRLLDRPPPALHRGDADCSLRRHCGLGHALPGLPQPLHGDADLRIGLLGAHGGRLLPRQGLPCLGRQVGPGLTIPAAARAGQWTKTGVHESGDAARRGRDFGSGEGVGEGGVDLHCLGEDRAAIFLAAVIRPPADLIEQAAVPAQRGRLAAAPRERAARGALRYLHMLVTCQRADDVAELDGTSARDRVPHQIGAGGLPGVPHRGRQRLRRAAELGAKKGGYASERILHQRPVAQRSGAQGRGHHRLRDIGQAASLQAAALPNGHGRGEEQEGVAAAAIGVDHQVRADRRRQLGYQVKAIAVVNVEGQHVAVRLGVEADPRAVGGLIEQKLEAV
jgi:hypothetical protein